MLYIKEESFILEELEKAFKKHKKFNYQLYYECMKACNIYGIEQLIHARAVLEERQIFGSENNNGFSFLLSYVSIVVTVITLWVSALTDKRKEALNIEPFIFVGIACCLGVVTIFLLHDRIIIPHRKNAYFHAIICDEIERRSK